MILSNYHVETNPTGFATCWWPVTSLRRAVELAAELSIKLASGEKRNVYQNPFWVVDESGKSICKFWQGKRFDAKASI